MSNVRKVHISYVNTIQDNAGQKIICCAEIVEGNLSVSELGIGVTPFDASKDAKKNAWASMTELQSRNGAYSNHINNPDNSSNRTGYKTTENFTTGNSYQSNQNNQGNQPSQDSKDRFNGGGDKPASENQIKLIKDMVAEHGINLEQVAERQGVSLKSNLTGEDANKLIRGIRKEKDEKKSRNQFFN